MDLRFGDVIDDAARYFKDAYDRKLAPYKFVEGMIDRTIEKLWPNNPMLACDSSCQSNLTLILNVNNNLCNSIVSASMALSVYSNPLF
ncbi:putative ATP citrate synthase [Helianthus anomalus]